MYEINKMPSAIDIGFTGEKLFREVQIDMTKWMQQMPDGVPSIVHIRPGETEADAYIAATTFEDNILTWQITAGDLGEIEGTGLMQVWLEEEENSSVVKRGKSIRIATRINKAINEADGTTPEAQEAWLEQMTALKVATVNAAEDAADAKDDAVSAKEAAEDAQDAAEDAQDAAEDAKDDAVSAKELAEAARDAAQSAVLHYPYVDPVSGNWMVWDASTEAFVDTHVHAQGATGAVPDIKVGTVTTLLPGSQATVERRSGSPDTAPVFDFGIPKGDTGQAENIYGNTINMTEEDDRKVASVINTKADKVTGGTEGNFAGLDANGNVTDSGKKASNFATDETMDGLAIVIRGNKATKNVSTGDLVLVENSTISGVSDGGYKALSNVSAGTAFTSSNLSALSKGAVNALSDQIATLDGKITNSHLYVNSASDVASAYTDMATNESRTIALSATFMYSLGLGDSSAKGTALKVSTYFDCEVVNSSGEYYTIRFNGSTGAKISSTSLSGKLSYSKAQYDSSDLMCVHKVGRICYIVCDVNSWYCGAGEAIRKGSASGAQWIVPSGFRPIVSCEIKEALNGKRISVYTTGEVACNEALSGTNLRFSGCYICAE